MEQESSCVSCTLKSKQIAMLKAMLADVQDARRQKFIGITPGGNPAIYYNTQAVEEALCGLGAHASALNK